MTAGQAAESPLPQHAVNYAWPENERLLARIRWTGDCDRTAKIFIETSPLKMELLENMFNASQGWNDDIEPSFCAPRHAQAATPPVVIG